MQIDAPCQKRHLTEARSKVCQLYSVTWKMVSSRMKVWIVPVSSRLAFADHLDAGHRHAALKTLAVKLAAALDLCLHPRAERVDRADAHAVQPTRYLVAASAELAACVQLRHDHRHRRQPGLLLDIDRDAGAVVFHGNAFILVDDDADRSQRPCMASSMELSTTS